jgi:arginine decarboxylase
MSTTSPHESAATPAPTSDPKSTWSIEAARALYNVEGWGDGYFDINEKGHVIVRPDKEHPDRALDLFELATDLEAQGVILPVLLRFSDILRSRIEALNAKFTHAIEEFEFTGGYTTVYPIKVNQQRHVVEEIVEFGKATGVGLECGSKPELQAVLALSESSDHLIICNGYKDEEFMRLALMGQRLGHEVFIVIEQVSELDVLLRVAEQMGVTPKCGVRIKLTTEGSGRWAQSGGEKSKFGLSPAHREAHRGRQARRRPAHSLPPRLADHRHSVHQARPPRTVALLRRTARDGSQHHARRRWRRPWRRLRRYAEHRAGER